MRPQGVLVGAVVLLFLPLAAWTAFSLLYFGFPLPMTAYSKFGSGLSRAVKLTATQLNHSSLSPSTGHVEMSKAEGGAATDY